MGPSHLSDTPPPYKPIPDKKRSSQPEHSEPSIPHQASGGDWKERFRSRRGKDQPPKHVVLDKDTARWEELLAAVGRIKEIVEGLEERMGGVKERMGGLEERMGRVEERMEGFEKRAGVAEEVLRNIGGKLDELRGAMKVVGKVVVGVSEVVEEVVEEGLRKARRIGEEEGRWGEVREKITILERKVKKIGAAAER
ncbi:hypothetical protein FGG08_006871 [Glutinoglossum americanum]|uniref:Uncharacterized protein n=1 Tax=Glutinoglossum americanum TaxID=1670608 RepID=A0A9P8KUI3_9PEZI|nr:hypothetical protein FGG08_006871 [Glutinoglossum americanum]